MRALFGRCLAVVTLAAAPAAAAGPFDEADRHFLARAEGSARVAEARAAYRAAIVGRVGAELAYGVQQIGRLALFEGQYLLGPDSANKARKAEIFDECRAFAARLEFEPGVMSQYAYWRLACNALWLKFATVADRLAALPEVKRYFNELVDENLELRPELGVDTRYQGGGVERALAAVYSNSLASLIRDGLPDGEKGLEMAERALRARPYPGDTVAGTDYYRNHRQKTETLLFLDRDAEASAWTAQTIAEIDEREADGDLPPDLEPESLAEREILRGLGNDWTLPRRWRAANR